MIGVQFLMVPEIQPGWYIVQGTPEGGALWSPVRFDDPWLATLALEKTHPEVAERLFRKQLERL